MAEMVNVEFRMAKRTYEEVLKRAAEKRNVHGEVYGETHGKRVLDGVVEMALIAWALKECDECNKEAA